MGSHINRIPAAQSGEYRIEKYRGYTRLWKGDLQIMIDSPKEAADLAEFREKVHGDVLINGLGIGFALEMALDKSTVDLVVVNEISKDVINLVGPYFVDNRLTINHADAFAARLPKDMMFDIIWHDICFTEQDMTFFRLCELHACYTKRLKKGGWQCSWEEAHLGYRLQKIGVP